jgi:hypothetical protein
MEEENISLLGCIRIECAYCDKDISVEVSKEVDGICRDEGHTDGIMYLEAASRQMLTKEKVFKEEEFTQDDKAFVPSMSLYLLYNGLNNLFICDDCGPELIRRSFKIIKGGDHA